MRKTLPFDARFVLAENHIMLAFEFLTAPASVIEIPAVPDARHVDGGTRHVMGAGRDISISHSESGI
jgi:hypothetical protein